MGRRSGMSICSYAAECSKDVSSTTSTTVEVALQNEIDDSERITVQATLDTRPFNTKRKYEENQREFVEWCLIRQFRDRDTVTNANTHPRSTAVKQLIRVNP
ncbi:hypothetical protein PHMEG_00022115 [Phytophthora megakarya]|uniref:Uncharacterized protein n=1 Tax=Phytophthora megakarya TaxID=4795 RepID=A0A225VKX2_9STRA|nr:hypothetical protein PHMEG_00022115 [Phytophthora megakarya]